LAAFRARQDRAPAKVERAQLQIIPLRSGPPAQRPLTSISARDVQTHMTLRAEAGVSPSTISLDGKIHPHRFQFGATTRDHLRQEVDETFLRAELCAMNAQRRLLGIISVRIF
jgi:hypothetical protein